MAKASKKQKSDPVSEETPAEPVKKFGAAPHIRVSPLPESLCDECGDSSCRAVMGTLATFVSKDCTCAKFVPK